MTDNAHALIRTARRNLVDAEEALTAQLRRLEAETEEARVHAETESGLSRYTRCRDACESVAAELTTLRAALEAVGRVTS